MNILLLSDTHSYLNEAILRHCEGADEIWHAGDIGSVQLADTLEALKPFRAVYGNIDGQEIRLRYPEHLLFSCEGVRVLMIHIGGYPGKYSPLAKKEIAENPPKVFISGHSHILKAMFDQKNQLLHLNPGAAGNQGWHKVRTMMRFEINGEKIENLEVIELGKR